jgi:hypothetical protein
VRASRIATQPPDFLPRIEDFCPNMGTLSHYGNVPLGTFAPDWGLLPRIGDFCPNMGTLSHYGNVPLGTFAPDWGLLSLTGDLIPNMGTLADPSKLPSKVPLREIFPSEGSPSTLFNKKQVFF